MKDRVLFVSGSLASGGAERQIANLACLLSDNGFQVSVLCYAFNDFYADILKDKGVDIIWLTKGSFINKLFRCRRFIREGGFSSVISFLEIPNFINEFAAIGGKRWKVIIGERSSQTKVFTSFKGRIMSFFHRFADELVCNSYNAEQMWREYSKIMIPKITTIYNIIKLGEPKNAYKYKKEGRINITVVASYQPIKNMMGLAASLLLLTDEERKQIRVDWFGRKEYSAGNDSAYRELNDFVVSNNLNETLYLHGETQDVLEIMNQSDAIGLFSKAEGLPNTICEGMSLGKPIIMTKVSDYSQLVDSSNGFLCDWDNHQSIADAIRSLICAKEDEIVAMGESSKLKAEEMFTRDVILEKWNVVLNSK